MRIGLRKMFYEELMNRRYMTFDEAESFAKLYGYRTSNLERRLRPSESDDIKSIKSTKPPFAIMGYRYTGIEQPMVKVWTQRQGSIL